VTDFDIRPVGSVCADDIRAVIADAFRRECSPEWFVWKHQDGPWGQSRGLVAVDETGVIGVRLLVPWRLRLGSRTVDCLRAMDGATAQRARRRGIFRALVNAVMEQERGHECVIYSTSVPASRDAYRSVGWTILPPIASQTALAVPARHASVEVADTLGQLPAEAPDSRATTDWTTAAMRWRIDPRSGRDYTSYRLRHADSAHGLICRVVSLRRARALSVVYAWGSPEEQRRLRAGAARSMRCAVIIEPVGEGTTASARRLGRSRPASTVSLWVSDGGADPELARLHSRACWAFTGADVEGVM